MTPQETKAAVLAECERLCPKEGDKVVLIGSIMLYKEELGNWSISFNCVKIWVSIQMNVDNDQFMAFFRILGIKDHMDDHEAISANLAAIEYEELRCACGASPEFTAGICPTCDL